MHLSSPRIARDRSGGLALFAISEAGRCVTRAQLGARGTWSDWIDMGIDVRAVEVVREHDLRLRVFVIGLDGAAWTVRQLEDGSGWGDWSSLGGALSQIRAIALRDGHIELFGILGDKALGRIKQRAPGADGFSGLVSLGGAVKAIDVAPNPRGELTVFAIGMDDAVWITTQRGASDVWNAWTSIGGKVLALAAGDARDGRLEVFGVGTDACVWQCNEGTDARWGRWERRGTQTVSSFRVTTAGDGRIDLFAVGRDDDAVWHAAQAEANGPWGSWQSLDGRAQEITAWSDDDGRIVVVAINPDGALECIAQPDPTVDAWSAWGRFPKNMPGVTRAGTTTLSGGEKRRSVPGQRPSVQGGELVPGTVFARDYKVEKLLARGGMGAVYIAEQTSTGKRRALKVMLPEILEDGAARERFMEEARATARIESDHVVETVAAGIDDDSQTPWLAMELLQGATLEDQIARDGQWGAKHARPLMAQLGHALGATHRAGVVHRDVKPANLFLEASRRSDVAFTMKLLDFGIAKASTSHAATRAVGTPWWMAPEQAQAGSAMTPAADVWAYGLVAFFALTGREFWRTAHVEQPSLGAILREMLVEPIPSAEARAAAMGVHGSLPKGFDGWFARCVAHDPKARFADGAAAAAAFEGLYRG